MTYPRSNRVVAFLLMVFLFFAFEGLIPIESFILKIFPKRRERRIEQEVVLLRQKITDLELELSIARNSEEKVHSNVIFGGGYLFSDYIFLDKGTNAGVEKGDIVVYESSSAVAKIEEAFTEYSKAVPFSSFGKKVVLRTAAKKNILFEAEGKGGGVIFVSLPKGSGIEVGETVWLAESPRFLVGVVESILKKESRDFEEISIILPFSLRSIAEADIVKNSVKE